jgi:hypothetical protein
MTRGVPAQTLTTTEALVIDGPNGVTRASREQFPDAGLSAAVAVTGVLLGAVLVRRAPRWLPLLAALPATLGLWEVWVHRLDAPAHRAVPAEVLADSVATLRSAAPWPLVPVEVVKEGDDVTFPLSRYAVPERSAKGALLRLEVDGRTLPLSCRDEPGGRVVCGGPP